MRLLLDTCTFLWIVGGDAALSDRVRQAFVDPENEVFLSAASAWEIAVKHRLGRLPLPAPPEEFVPEHLVGSTVVAVAGVWLGDVDDGPDVLAPYRAP